jgi:hypothetical protein
MKFSCRTLIAAVLFSLIPAAAQACSACILADPKTSATYLKMTLVMSALPLALLGGLTFWLWRRYSPRNSGAVTVRRREMQPSASPLEHHSA